MEVFTERHRDDVVELLRRVLLPEDVAEADAIVTRLRRPGADGPGHVELAFGRVIGVVLAAVGHADPAVGHLDLIAVDPEYRRRGLGTALIEAAERDLRDQGCTSVRVAGNPPDYVWPGIDVRYTPAICTVATAGYHHDQTAWNMTVDLADPTSQALVSTAEQETRLAQLGIDIRQATDGDIAALLPTVDTEWGTHWVREIESSRGLHVAVKDAEPIAFAAWGGARPSWFGPMGTLPSAEGLGIGSVLLRRCLQEQAATGLTRAQIGWVGPVPFYSGTADAFIERVFFLYRKPLQH